MRSLLDDLLKLILESKRLTQYCGNLMYLAHKRKRLKREIGTVSTSLRTFMTLDLLREPLPVHSVPVLPVVLSSEELNEMVAVKTFLRSGFPFNYDTNAASDASGLSCGEPTLAVQAEAESTDINFIIRQYGITGHLPPETRPPQFSDFDENLTYHQAMNMVLAAEQEFMRLPPKIRERFANDPQKLMNFLDEPNNRAEALDLGLIATPAEAREPPLPVAGVDGGSPSAPVVVAPTVAARPLP